MAGKLTSRGKALRWLSNHRGLTEDPPGTNTDRRRDGIRKAQLDCAGGASWLIGQPWCGVWCFNALQAAGVQGIGWRLASVANIEDDARARRKPFRDWIDPRRDTRWHHKVMRGDLVVLFGRGVHVETVRWHSRRLGIVVTDGGNTSPGNSGSQANGGGAFRRVRPIGAVHGFSRVDYPNN